MAKTRAQRKAERRRRQQAEQRRRQADPAAEQEERAQEETRLGVSGEVAEAEAVIETGADVEDYGERVEERPDTGGDGSPVPGVMPEPVRPETEPEAPAPSRADVGRPDVDARARDSATRDLEPQAPAEPRESRRERRQREKEERRKARARELQKKGQAEKAERRRGPVLGFLLSCWAELKRVQWPDRDTLVQASAVTFIFVAIMAAYLGALDAAFNWFVKQLL
jgi:preprotein translocase SecE subunit